MRVNKYKNCWMLDQLSNFILIAYIMTSQYNLYYIKVYFKDCKIITQHIKTMSFQALWEDQRSKSTFTKQDLTKVIYEGADRLAAFLKIQKTIDQNSILKFNPQFIHSHRKQNMLVHANKLIQYHKQHDFNYQMKSQEVIFFSEQMPLSLHFYMFLITLTNLCTDKQMEFLFKPALKGQILGCYAQTQLGHGSDVQNLMTTATYDDSDDTFIMNMPSTAASKWWIGDLGNYANHALIFAQLIIKNKRYGIHAFVVPIRDKNHAPYPGVEVGQVGPKYGFNCKDNGYIIFKNYKIPRRYMLMRYTKVSNTGQYQRRGNEKISYATMLIIRSAIPFACYFGLSKACVIAVRYSLYRTQFKDELGKQIPILDYQIQQQKVFTRLAECFAQLFGSHSIRQIAREVFQDAKQKQRFDRLNQAHCLASGLKAIFSTDTLAGIQILRRSMGGHGFSMYSGLPGIIAQLGPTPTYQGQNTILYLQVARLLIKSLGFIAKGKPLPPTVQYLREVYRDQPFSLDMTSINQAFQPQNIRKIMMYHSCQATKKVALKMQTLIAQGNNPKYVWDSMAGLDLKQAAISHTYFWIFQNFQTKIFNVSKNEKVRQVLTRLLLIYGIDKILVRSSSYIASGVVSGNTLKLFQQAKQKLFSQIRPDALNIVEAFQYSDNTLHSALGIVSADPYETLLQWVKNKNEVNEPEVKADIHKLWFQTKKQLRPKL